MGRKTKREPRNSRSEAAEPTAQGPDRESGTVREWTKSVLIAVALFLFLRTFLLQTFVIISGSMEGTLLVGDMLVANRLAVGPRIPGTRIRIPAYSEPRRGDVMVFDPHHEVDMKLVKRIAGLPGDTLQMRDGVLILNGREVPEPYINSVVKPDARSPDFQWQVDYLSEEVDRSTYVPSLHNWGPLVVSPLCMSLRRMPRLFRAVPTGCQQENRSRLNMLQQLREGGTSGPNPDSSTRARLCWHTAE